MGEMKEGRGKRKRGLPSRGFWLGERKASPEKRKSVQEKLKGKEKEKSRENPYKDRTLVNELRLWFKGLGYSQQGEEEIIIPFLRGEFKQAYDGWGRFLRFLMPFKAALSLADWQKILRLGGRLGSYALVEMLQGRRVK